MFSEFNLINPVSPVMVEFVFFHDVVLHMLVFMLVLVLGGGIGLVTKSYTSVDFLEFKALEIFWTIFPGLILFFLALPSLKLLYYLDLSLSVSPAGSVKVDGHQWYWSYSYFGFGGEFLGDNIEYDSYMLPTGDIGFGDLRSLEVDLPLLVPIGGFIRFVVTSTDVMHSFTVNGVGLKVDAVPGRLNLGFLYSDFYGSFYGQCSEICGVNHSFMPINLEVLNL